MSRPKSSQSIENQIALTLRKTAGILGVLCAILGISVIAGWIADISLLISINPNFQPMQANTALAFIFSGIALAASASGRVRTSRILGLLTILISVVPMRMSMNSAFCFFLTGTALVLDPKALGYALMGILGAIIAPQGFIPLTGYLSGGETPLLWGGLSGMAVHTSGGFLAVGVALIALAWSRSSPKETGGPRWAKYAVFLGVLTLGLVQYGALKTQQENSLSRSILNRAKRLRAAVSAELEPRSQALQRMAQRWEAFGGTRKEHWKKDAALYVKHQGYDAIVWIDKSLSPRWMAVSPERSKESIIGYFSKKDLAAFRTSAGPALKVLKYEDSASRELLLLVPLRKNGISDGMLAGVINLNYLLSPLFLREIKDGYGISLKESGLLFMGASPPSPELDRWAASVPIDSLGLAFELRLWPNHDRLISMSSPIPGIILGVGLLTAFLLGLTVHLAQRERTKARALEKSNLGLEFEVTKRKRAESSLREHKDKLEETVEKRTIELEEVHLQLAEKESLAAVGSMAAVMAHEIRNPLGSIVTAAKAILKGDLSPEEKELLRSVLANETHRLDKTLRDFLSYARPRDLKKEDTDLNALTREILSAVKADKSILNDIVISDQFDPKLAPFAFDGDQIRQVIWNLLLNALQAMDGSGTLTIATHLNNRYAALSVKDTGPGIPDSVRDRIFKPFQTTKTKGNGLGLAIAERIVSSHGGKIDVESSPQKGACFTVRLPLIPA